MPLFLQSRSFQSELTSLYDFVNPTAVALWNLRRQVADYVAESPSAKASELQSRFVTGSGIGSANLRRHCMDTSWDSQLDQLGALTLYQAVGHLEGWVDSLPFGTTKAKTALMFPAPRDQGSAQDFIDNLAPSELMRRAFGPTLADQKHCFPSRLEDLLVVLRAYKRARNNITHTGGRAGEPTRLALMEAAARGAGLGRSGKPLQLPSIDGDGRIKVGLLAAQGGCALVLKLVLALDHALACTVEGERAMLAQWQAAHGRQDLSSKKDKRNSRLAFLSKKAGLPPVADLDSLYELLRSKYLVL